MSIHVASGVGLKSAEEPASTAGQGPRLACKEVQSHLLRAQGLFAADTK